MEDHLRFFRTRAIRMMELCEQSGDMVQANAHREDAYRLWIEIERLSNYGTFKK